MRQNHFGERSDSAGNLTGLIAARVAESQNLRRQRAALVRLRLPVRSEGGVAKTTATSSAGR
jgi:hypothetical protein